MTLNYIIVGLIFSAGAFLVLASLFGAPFLKGDDKADEAAIKMRHETNRSARGFFNPVGNVSRLFTNLFAVSNRRQAAYFFLGIIIIILGFVAIFTGFLEEKIEI